MPTSIEIRLTVRCSLPYLKISFCAASIICCCLTSVFSLFMIIAISSLNKSTNHHLRKTIAGKYFLTIRYLCQCRQTTVSILKINLLSLIIDCSRKIKPKAKYYRTLSDNGKTSLITYNARSRISHSSLCEILLL